MDGEIESREVTPPCRADKQQVQDINPNLYPQNTHVMGDRAINVYLGTFSLLAVFFFFLSLFLTEPLPLSSNAHTFLSLDICSIGPCDSPSPALCLGGLFPLLRLPPPGSLTAGADSLARQATFSEGHFLLQAAGASCLSLARIVTEIASVGLYLSGRRRLPLCHCVVSLLGLTFHKPSSSFPPCPPSPSFPCAGD